MFCFYMPPRALEICIHRRATRATTNVFETMIKPLLIPDMLQNAIKIMWLVLTVSIATVK